MSLAAMSALGRFLPFVIVSDFAAAERIEQCVADIKNELL